LQRPLERIRDMCSYWYFMRDVQFLLLIFLVFHNAASFPVHIFTFHKDESSSLPRWFEYHRRIVTHPSNIHIIDNGSNNPDSKRQLETLRSKGVDVTSCANDFRHKSETLTQEMRKYRKSPAFLIPLDIDEYIVHLLPDNTFSADANQIIRSFQSLPNDGLKFKFSSINAFACGVATTSPKTISIRTFGYAESNCMSKTFFFSYGFFSTDQGNHHGGVVHDIRCTKGSQFYHAECGKCYHSDTRMGIVHFGGDMSFTFQEYSEKMTRRAAEYNFSEVRSREDCLVFDGGRHYCFFMVKKQKWPKYAIETQFRERTACSNGTYVSDEFRNVFNDPPSLT
jgi:hypothetical protein